MEHSLELGGPFLLGDWTVDPSVNAISKGSKTITLEPKVLEVLLCLAQHHGETVSKEQLLDEVWPNTFVVDSVITKTISTLRHELGDDARHPEYILTVPTKGYRLLKTIQKIQAVDTAEANSTAKSTAANRLWLWLGLLLLVLLAASYWWTQRPQAEPVVTPGEQVFHLAILPFQSPAIAGEYAYVAPSLYNEITAELSKFTSPRIYLLDGIESNALPAALRSINADGLLRAQLAVNQEQVEVKVALTSGNEQTLLWQGQYEYDLGETQKITRDLIRDLSEHIQSEVPLQGNVADQPRVVDPYAYQLYLKAHWYWAQRTIESIQRSNNLFKEVVELDPLFADGFASLAQNYITMGNYDIVGAEKAYLNAARAAQRAVELAPQGVESLTAKGLVALEKDWDFASAIEHYQQAVQLAPGPTSARQFLAEAYSITGQYRQGVQAIGKALEQHPYSPLLLAVQGIILNAAGQPQAALEALDKALLLDAEFRWLHRYRAYALTRLGREAEAFAARVEQVKYYTDNRQVSGELEAAYRELGMDAFWHWQLAYTDTIPSTSQGYPTLRAEALAGLGRDQEALRWLAEIERRKGEYFLHLQQSPAFDALKTSAEYQAVFSTYGLGGQP